MSDTPETDAILESICGDYDDHVEFTRKLERERNSLLAVIEPLLAAYQQFAPCPSGIVQDAEEAIAAVKNNRLP